MTLFITWIKNIFINLLFILIIILFVSFIRIPPQNNFKEVKIGNLENNNNSGYIGYLVIDKIDMLLGFYDPFDERNDVDQNIEVLKSSGEGRLFIAGHSGVGKVSFFNNLRYLVVGDEIKIIYQNNTYQYYVTNIYRELKDGDIQVKIAEKEKVLVLTTCDQIAKGYQLVIKAILKN